MQEYLLVNNLGGYSSSTVKDGNTRKYHGLLVAGLLPDMRKNIVNRLEESVTIDEKKYYLSTNHYKNNVIHPKGFHNLNSFQNKDYPVWYYRIGDVDIVKSLSISCPPDDCMITHWKQNTVFVRFEIYNPHKRQIHFEVVPLITNRYITELKKKNDNKLQDIKVIENLNKITVDLDHESSLDIDYSGCKFNQFKDYYNDFYYPIDASRGESCLEDLRSIGSFKHMTNSTKANIQFVFSYTNFNYRQNSMTKEGKLDNPFLEYVTSSTGLLDDINQNNDEKNDLSSLKRICVNRSSDFITNYNNSSSIVAGYHWFGEWGRDTFMSFKGLLLINKKYDIAESILYKWAKLMKNGLLPNRPFQFDYNSIDAMLWFTIAIWEYYQATKSQKIIDDLTPVIEKIYLAILDSKNSLEITKYGFLLDKDNTNARTWMDAKINGQPVIDRSGLAIEIQALWYNYLHILDKFKELINDQTHVSDIKKLQSNIKINFEKVFWDKSINCLADTDKLKSDRRITPNQLFVLYLPFNDVVGFNIAKQLLHTVHDKLVTPVGLKSLNSEHKDFHKFYSGSEEERAESYHQGTIWTHLLGVYCVAYLNIYSNSAIAKEYIQDILVTFYRYLKEYKLDTIPEIFEVDTLRQDGCISQAWSTALILEAIEKLKLGVV